MLSATCAASTLLAFNQANAAAGRDGCVRYAMRVRCGGRDWAADASYDDFAVLRDALGSAIDAGWIAGLGPPANPDSA